MRMDKSKLSPGKSRGSSLFIGASLSQRAQFYRQLHSLLHAGMPLSMALQHTTDGSAFPLRPILQRLTEHTAHGGQVSEKLADYPNIFPEWEASVIRAGELSGSLADAMGEIADALEMEWDLRSRIETVTFPSRSTLMVAMLIGLILGSLMGTAFSAHAVFIRLGFAFGAFVGIVLTLMAINYVWRVFARSRIGAAFVATILPALPLVGPVCSGIARIRFVRTLATLWQAGVAPMESLQVAAHTTGNHQFIMKMKDAMQDMSEGVTLSSVLSKTDFLPEATLHMLRTGETSGTVSEALNTVAKYLSLELAGKVKTLPAKLLLIYYLLVVPVIVILCYCAYVVEH